MQSVVEQGQLNTVRLYAVLAGQTLQEQHSDGPDAETCVSFGWQLLLSTAEGLLAQC